VLTFAVVTSRGKGPLRVDYRRRLQGIVDQGTLDDQLTFPVADRAVWFNDDRSIAVVIWALAREHEERHGEHQDAATELESQRSTRATAAHA
jgi:hypothetical protein